MPGDADPGPDRRIHDLMLRKRSMLDHDRCRPALGLDKLGEPAGVRSDSLIGSNVSGCMGGLGGTGGVIIGLGGTQP